MSKDNTYGQGDVYHSEYAGGECVVVNPYQHNGDESNDLSSARIRSRDPLDIALPGSAPHTDVKKVTGHLTHKQLQQGFDNGLGVHVPVPVINRRRKIATS